MPNVKTVFQCSCCQRIYDTVEQAEKCEEGHILPESISKSRYTAPSDKYPSSISVKMADGNIREYLYPRSMYDVEADKRWAERWGYTPEQAKQIEEDSQEECENGSR